MPATVNESAFYERFYITVFNKFEKYSDEINKAMRNPGLMLVSGLTPPNIMSISWGATGFLFGKPIFIVAVRKKRHTYRLLENSGVFTVNVPRKDLRNEIMQIGFATGANVNKFNEFHLHPVKARSVDTYIVGDCSLHIECRIILKTEVEGALLSDEIKSEIYDDSQSYHDLFYGEIVDIYET